MKYIQHYLFVTRKSSVTMPTGLLCSNRWFQQSIPSSVLKGKVPLVTPMQNNITITVTLITRIQRHESEREISLAFTDILSFTTFDQILSLSLSLRLLSYFVSLNFYSNYANTGSCTSVSTKLYSSDIQIGDNLYALIFFWSRFGSSFTSHVFPQFHNDLYKYLELSFYNITVRRRVHISIIVFLRCLKAINLTVIIALLKQNKTK